MLLRELLTCVRALDRVELISPASVKGQRSTASGFITPFEAITYFGDFHVYAAWSRNSGLALDIDLEECDIIFDK